MGLKFLYYIDTSANWTLFTLGIMCVPFGIGGMLLTTPVNTLSVTQPWYHATGIWVGMVFLSIAMMMPFARFHPTFLRVSIFLTFLATIVAAIGLGVGIDEFTSWFENPTVKTFGSDSQATDSDQYVAQSAHAVVKQYADFDMFHKIRVIVVMSSNLLGICMLLFREVTLGLVVFDELTTKGYDVFTPEEEMMYQAMAEREMAGGDDAEKADFEAGYQPILYAGGKPGMKISELPDIHTGDNEEEEENYKDIIEKIKAFGELNASPASSIYDPDVFVFSDDTKKATAPTYTDAEGNPLSELSTKKNIPHEETLEERSSVYPSQEEKDEDSEREIKAITEKMPLIMKK